MGISTMEIIVATAIVEMLYVLANAANVLAITTTLVSILIALHAIVNYTAAKINVTNVATTICLETTILETTILEIFLEVDLQEAITKMEAILVPENELIFNDTNEYLNLIDSKVKDVFQERNKQIFVTLK